jgi:hypothetical protein
MSSRGATVARRNLEKRTSLLDWSVIVCAVIAVPGCTAPASYYERSFASNILAGECRTLVRQRGGNEPLFDC